jgi:putative tRNA adenosine deaminase-associated protein
VSYFAAAAVRGSNGWTATEVDLTGAADVDEVADRLRDVDPDAGVSLLFVEADDLYLAVLRLDQGEDLRVFGSDVAFAEETRIGALLLGEIEEPALDLGDEEPVQALDEDGRPAPEPAAEPVGDADLLVDLGVPAAKLLELCAHEGLMPADVTAEVCQAIGCGDEVEELREG